MGKSGCIRIVLVLTFAVATFARADDRADARKTIETAIVAAGGEAKLAKYQAATWKAHVTDRSQEVALKYTATYAHQAPAQYRMASDMEGVFTLVVNGKQGFLASGGVTRPMAGAELAEHQESLYAFGLARLLLFKDPALRLALAGNDQVDSRPVVGVKVTRQGRRDVTLYFDKETGLVAKTARRVNALEEGRRDLLQETYFTDYKDVNGVQWASRIADKRNGKPYREMETSDEQLLEKLDNGMFAKP